MNRREQIKQLVNEILDIIGYGNLSSIVQMRINDLDDEKVEKVYNYLYQTVKKW